MKYLFTLILTLFLTYTFAQNPKIEVLQINAKWNKHNDVLLNRIPKNYKGYFIEVKYALIEDQGPEFKKSFASKPLPIVVLRVGNNTKYQWTADLSFKLKLGAHDVLGTIDKVLNLK